MDEDSKQSVTLLKQVCDSERLRNTCMKDDFDTKDGAIPSQGGLNAMENTKFQPFEFLNHENINGLAGGDLQENMHECGETMASLDPKTPKKRKRVKRSKKYRPKVVVANQKKRSPKTSKMPKQEFSAKSDESVFFNDILDLTSFLSSSFSHGLKRKRAKRNRKIEFSRDFKHFSLIQTKRKRSKRNPRRYFFGSVVDCGEISPKVLDSGVRNTHAINGDYLFNNNIYAEHKEKDVILYAENSSTNCKECSTSNLGSGTTRGLIEEEIVPLVEKDKSLEKCDNEIRALVPYQKKHKLSGKIDMDMLTKDLIKVIKHDNTSGLWRVLQITDGNAKDSNEESDKWWQAEREILTGRIRNFIHRMHLIQGDRRFSPWKGSVVDSVIGVFLTQNVSDHLSSSAYMSLAAKYPPLSTTSDAQETKLDANILKEKSAGEKEDFKKVEEVVKTGVENKATVDERGKVNVKRKRISKQKSYTEEDWENLRIVWEPIWKKYSSEESRSIDRMDSINWEAVRCADVNDIAQTIKIRGQHNEIAERIKDCLELVWKVCGSIDLEWLRNAPPEIVEKFLKEIYGLGIKSRECIRLLSLYHAAFPVDTNVGRIAVRLGWVPLQPGVVPIHRLEVYPLMDTIQAYLWPRLCKLDQQTLYELHYQMITFGKAFCAKANPNCNACPMKGECKHFASAVASERLSLPVSTDATTESSETTKTFSNFLLEYNFEMNAEKSIVEVTQPLECIDIEDYYFDDYDYIPAIKPVNIVPHTAIRNNNSRNDAVNQEAMVHLWPRVASVPPRLDYRTINTNSQSILEDNNSKDDEISWDMIPLSPRVTSLSPRKLKYISRLRTEHEVYELPDSHPLLMELERREPDDPCPYLLAIWLHDEIETLYQKSTENIEVSINETKCHLRENTEMKTTDVVHGTILIPCRTAMGGSFPLNGTYFQVNEMFADDASSHHPISVPRNLIWNLPRRTVYFAASPAIVMRGLELQDIKHCFNQGFICVKGFDRATREPKNLAKRLHTPPGMAAKQKTKKYTK